MSDGFQGFNDSGPRRLPNRIIVQGMTNIDGLDARKGTFADPEAKREIGKAIDAVVLKVDTIRRLRFGKGERGAPGQKYKCFSDDGINPSSRVQNPVSDTCRGCPEEFKDLVYRMTCYDIQDSSDRGEPVVFTIDARRTGLKAVRTFVRGIQDQRKAARDFTVRLVPDEQKNDQGVWWTLGFENVTPLTNGLRSEIERAFTDLGGGGRNTNNDIEEASTDEIPF